MWLGVSGGELGSNGLQWPGGTSQPPQGRSLGQCMWVECQPQAMLLPCWAVHSASHPSCPECGHSPPTLSGSPQRRGLPCPSLSLGLCSEQAPPELPQRGPGPCCTSGAQGGVHWRPGGSQDALGLETTSWEAPWSTLRSRRVSGRGAALLHGVWDREQERMQPPLQESSVWTHRQGRSSQHRAWRQMGVMKTPRGAGHLGG